MALSDVQERSLRACITALRTASATVSRAVAHVSLVPVEIFPARGITTPVTAYEAVSTTGKLLEHQIQQLEKLLEQEEPSTN